MNLFKIINILTLFSLLSLVSSFILFVTTMKKLGTTSKNSLSQDISNERSKKINIIARSGLCISIFTILTFTTLPLSITIFISDILNFSTITTYIAMAAVSLFNSVIIILNFSFKKK